MKRKIFSRVLVMTLCMLIFAGCGDDKEATDGNNAPVSEDTNNETEKDAADVSEEEKADEQNQEEVLNEENKMATLEIDGDVYQMQVAASELTDNGWTIEEMHNFIKDM